MPGTADELPEGRGHALIASICSAGAASRIRDAWLPAMEELLRSTVLAVCACSCAMPWTTVDSHASACSCCAGVERAADMASAAAAAGEEVAAEGRRRLAELAAVAVERLLALGRSLDAQVPKY